MFIKVCVQQCSYQLKRIELSFTGTPIAAGGLRRIIVNESLRVRMSYLRDSLITSNANKTISKLEAALSKIEESLAHLATTAEGTTGDQDILPTEIETLDRLKNSKLQSSIKEVLQQHVIIGQQHNDEREQQQREEQQQQHKIQQQEELRKENDLHEQQLQLQQQREQLQWEQRQFEQRKLEQQQNLEKRAQEHQQWNQQHFEQQSRILIDQPPIPSFPDDARQNQYQHILRQQQIQAQQFAQLQEQCEQLQRSLDEERAKRQNLEQQTVQQQQQQQQHYYNDQPHGARRVEFGPQGNGPTWSNWNTGSQHIRGEDNHHSYRFSQPLHRWKIEEYGGENDIRKLGEFLNQVKMYATTEGMDDATLLRVVKQLLKGRAFEWYTRSYRSMFTWEAFKTGIKNEFLPSHYSEIFKQDLYLRFQGANESFTSFYRDLIAIFDIIEPPMPESEKLFILKSHLNTDFVPIAAASQVSSVQQLVKVCKDFEVSRSYAMKNRSPSNVLRSSWQKPFHPPNNRPSGFNAQPQQNLYRNNIVRQQVHMVEGNFPEQLSDMTAEEYQERELAQFDTAMNNAEEVATIEEEVASLIINPIDTDNRQYAEIKVLGLTLQGLLDSGATCTLIGGELTKISDQLGLKKYPVKGEIRTVDNSPHQVSYFTYLPIAYNNKTHTLPVLFIESMPKSLILGMDFWDVFGVKAMVCGLTLTSKVNHEIISSLSQVQKQQLTQTIAWFPTAENKRRLGRTNLYHHRIETGTAQPFKQKYYPMAKFVLDDLNKEIDRMLKLDVIEEAMCCPWNNATVAVKKKDGSMRLCLDARKLNSIIIQEAYPIPHIASIMNNLSGSKFLSSIDLESAFWQIPLEPESKPKTAFTIPQRGHYQFKVVPFGLSTASQALSRVMAHIFIDLEPRVFVYLDDLILATETFEEHLHLLKEIAKRLHKAGLTINAEKSVFCRKSLNYLGYILDEKGKVEAISKFPTPSTKKEVQRFIGMCGWYRRFIRDFSKTATPLTELTRAKAKFKWSEECEKAFQTLKNQLISAPILTTPNYTKPFAVACDASDVAIGAILTQETENGEQVICYFSQKLTPSERKYSVTQRECLAVIRSIEKFRGYLEGSHFTVYCDHSSLSYLKTMKNPTPLLARWILRLNAYSFDIKYRKGTANVVSDCLSRIELNNTVATVQLDTSDQWYNELLEKVTADADSFPDFRIIGGVLYKNCAMVEETGGRSHRWKQVVPGPARTDLIRRFHDIPTAAHLGFERTHQRIQREHYWPNMSIDIKKYVRACQVCKAYKAPNSTLTPTLGNPKPAKLPWELISVDWVGPMTRSRKGFTVLFVVVDWITKFVIVEPFRTANAQKMVQFLEEYVFLRFSTPRIIVSDSGSQFLSQVFQSLLKRYNVTHMRTVFYTPMCNAAERTNRTLITCIRSLLDVDQREWDAHIQQVVCAINTTKHDTLGCSPYFCNFGREHILFTETYPLANLNTPQDPVKDQELRLTVIKNIQEFVLKRINKAHEASKQHYNFTSSKSGIRSRRHRLEKIF
ncbi:uncharacterized protein LOC129737905 [Uranotaenia lowii]|uniref:uncharacterized protein LOC129737905 n=1 Tax=Uranotaenia lowii TaxID=190385 RepID=UPI00247A8751|nr:uncharacterized protein LOC129737905 [Uranotaenia lowii]